MAIFWWLRCRKGICRPVLSSVSLAINFRLSTGPINGSRCHLTGEEIQDRTTAVGAPGEIRPSPGVRGNLRDQVQTSEILQPGDGATQDRSY